MGSIKILSGKKYIVDQIMNLKFKTDIVFLNQAVYDEAVKHGFRFEKFVEKNKVNVTIQMS